jgi:hypothetical protein
MIDKNKESKIPIDERQICLDLLDLFTIENQPGSQVVTEGQLEIFWCIVYRPSTRAQIICSTQYGKSLMVALACIIVSCIQEEVISVVAPSADKAKIIMRYYIEHIGDNIMFREKLDKHTRLDRLQQEESKDRIMLRKDKDTGAQGGIFVVSANTSNTKKSLEAAMGLGSKIVIGDEYCLIPDDTEATIFRMISGKGPDAFYCKIGNPFYRDAPNSHFYKTWNADNNYYKIFIDYKQALAEGRYQPAFIEEAREKPAFDVLFECKFPDPGATDKDGWTQLLSEKEIEMAQEDAENIPFAGTLMLGCDCAEGKGVDASTNILRAMNVAECIYDSNTVDEMQHAGQIIRDMDDLKINPLNVAIDDSGGGTIARIREQRRAVQAINTAERAFDPTRYFNKRAEGYWLTRQWIKNGGKLKPHKRWAEFKYIKYKVHSSGRIIIQDKDEIRKKAKLSPDLCDGLMHTFLIKPHMTTDSADEIFFKRKMLKNKMRAAVKRIRR